MLEKDVVIIGGGAAGLICAIEAGKRGQSVIVIEQEEKVGKKILISGGGRCNFTNKYATHENFISQNLHFCKSALARYTPLDFMSLVIKHKISYHEKKLGQLFCDGSSRQIVSMLEKECKDVKVEIVTGCKVNDISINDRFLIKAFCGNYSAGSLVISTGGISIPKMGATDFGYRIAKQFDMKLTEILPGLVPLTLKEDEREVFKRLSGVSIDSIVSYGNISFRENILFTHKGLSGPAILQISSYWKPGRPVSINLLPDVDTSEKFYGNFDNKIELVKLLWKYFPNRFAQVFCEVYFPSKPLNQFSQKTLISIYEKLHNWMIFPSETEGFDKAEVTVGGIDTNELSSKTMESKKVKNLYFIGEVVDVTGWLGGYNFQWAWASGFVAGQYV